MFRRICQSCQKEKDIEEEKVYLTDRHAYILLILVYSASELAANVLAASLAV